MCKLPLSGTPNLYWQDQSQFQWHLHADLWQPFVSMRKTVKHSNECDICGPGWKFEWSQTVSWFAFLQNYLIHKSSCHCSILDFSKRVYQGVRVKHTVKDLLAEKRSQQTNGTRYSVSTLLLSFYFCASSLLYLSGQNRVATVDILLVPQLRGHLFSRRRRKITFPVLVYILALKCGLTIHTHYCSLRTYKSIL